MTGFVVGVTGGIGSGKSAVAAAFEARGVPAFDADRMGRVVVEPGRPALTEIARHFGPEILTGEGRLDRAALRERIFADPEAKRWLEALLHPLINEELERRLASVESPYALLVSPLLFETGQHALCDRVLVIDLPEALQRERAARRDEVPPEQIDAIMASQMGREERLTRADAVLDNSGDPEAMERQVSELHRRYLALAREAGRN